MQITTAYIKKLNFEFMVIEIINIKIMYIILWLCNYFSHLAQLSHTHTCYILCNLMKTWIGRNSHCYWLELCCIAATSIELNLFRFMFILFILCTNILLYSIFIDEFLAVVFSTKPGFVSMIVSRLYLDYPLLDYFRKKNFFHFL